MTDTASKHGESYDMQRSESSQSPLTEVAEMSAETLSIDVDSLGTSSTTALYSPSRQETIISSVKQKLRSIATSMVSTGPDGPDEKPLSPQETPRETPSIRQIKKSSPPRPPFSCVPVYAFILTVLFLIIVMGSVNAVLELKPEFIYGPKLNETDWINGTMVL